MEKQQAELEISMIKKIMEDSRKIVVYDGVGFIIWGVLVTAALLGTYFVILFKQYSYIPWIWVFFMGGGWIYSIWHYRRKESKNKVKTLAGKIMGGLWISAGITMSIIGFVSPLGHSVSPYAISPLISVILGITYSVSGIVHQQVWLRNLAVGWWAGAVIMFLYPGPQTLLIFACMMVVLQTIPGIIIYSTFKKEYQPINNG
jgi:hypothetical protein